MHKYEMVVQFLSRLPLAGDKKDASGGSSDIVPEPNEGKQNGTAPLQDISSVDKVSAFNNTSQVCPLKILLKSKRSIVKRNFNNSFRKPNG